MDAASRAELDALRERAYGPDADILTDPVAIARLEALEDELRGPPRADAEPVSSPRSARRSTTEPADTLPPLVERAQRDETRRTRPAVVVGLTVLALVVVGLLAAQFLTGDAEPEASATTPTFVADFDSRPGYERLIGISLDGSFARSAPRPSSEVPVMSGLGIVQWADPLGEYYGFELWIGGVVTPDGEVLCISAAAGDAPSAAQCAPHAQWGREGLLLGMPYTAIEPSDRPDGLDPSEELAFWWVPVDAVVVLEGGEPAG